MRSIRSSVSNAGTSWISAADRLCGVDSALSLYRGIWCEENKLRLWLQVELAYLTALRKRRKLTCTVAQLALFGQGARRVKLEDVLAFEKERGHDFVAFIERVLVEVPENAVSRAFHSGLTSSDVEDTALALMMDYSFHRAIEVLEFHEKKAASGIRRRCIEILKQARCEISYGKLSGPMGNYSSVSPLTEAIALSILGLKIEPCGSQIIPRDRHASALLSIVRGVGLLAPQNALALRSYIGPVMENVALWHERDISHSSVERIVLPKAFEMLFRSI